MAGPKAGESTSGYHGTVILTSSNRNHGPVMPAGDPSLAENLERLRTVQQAAEAAWARLYRACWPEVVKAATRMLGRELRSAYAPADFVADAMLDLLRDFEQLDFPSLDAMIAYRRARVELKIRQAGRRHHHLT
jgi:hypothetical protein